MRTGMPPPRWRSGSRKFAMVKVSIIVPVHNSESYLHKCVDSLLAQTLPEIEIILVDDFSSDGSRNLIDNYVNQNPGKVRKLFLEKNLRQGGARNRGMEIARGEYLCFVDSDDFVEPDMCQALYEAAKGADMCGADYYIDTGSSLRNVDLDYGEGFVMTPERKAYFAGHCGYFWSRIYRREFLEQHALRFPEGTFYEDAHFNFLTILLSNSAVKAPGRYYHYYQSENSTMRSDENPRQYERIAIPTLILQECKTRGIYEQYRNTVDQKYISMQMSNIRYTCLGKFKKPDIRQLGRIGKAVKADCPRFVKCPHYKDNPFTLRVYLRLTLLWPPLAVLAYKMDWAVELLGILAWKLRRK